MNSRLYKLGEKEKASRLPTHIHIKHTQHRFANILYSRYVGLIKQIEKNAGVSGIYDNLIDGLKSTEKEEFEYIIQRFGDNNVVVKVPKNNNRIKKVKESKGVQLEYAILKKKYNCLRSLSIIYKTNDHDEMITEHLKKMEDIRPTITVNVSKRIDADGIKIEPFMIKNHGKLFFQLETAKNDKRIDEISREIKAEEQLVRDIIAKHDVYFREKVVNGKIVDDKEVWIPAGVKKLDIRIEGEDEKKSDKAFYAPIERKWDEEAIVSLFHDNVRIPQGSQSYLVDEFVDFDDEIDFATRIKFDSAAHESLKQSERDSIVNKNVDIINLFLDKIASSKYNEIRQQNIRSATTKDSVNDIAHMVANMVINSEDSSIYQTLLMKLKGDKNPNNLLATNSYCKRTLDIHLTIIFLLFIFKINFSHIIDENDLNYPVFIYRLITEYSKKFIGSHMLTKEFFNNENYFDEFRDLLFKGAVELYNGDFTVDLTNARIDPLLLEQDDRGDMEKYQNELYEELEQYKTVSHSHYKSTTYNKNLVLSELDWDIEKNGALYYIGVNIRNRLLEFDHHT